MKHELIKRILHHIAAFKYHPSQRFLDACYGPLAKPLRAQVMAMLLDRKVTGSDKAVQWGNFRETMWKMIGAEGDCIASREHGFEDRATKILETQQ